MLRARSTRRAIVALSVCAVLLFPTLADAKRGDSKGKGHGPIAHANKGKGHEQLVTFRLKGTAVAGDPCSEKVLAMSVRHSNRHARGLVGNEVTLDLSNARLKVADVNGDRARNLDDVATGDEVKVQARVPRGSSPDAAVPARHVVVKHPETQSTDPDDPYGEGFPEAPYGSGFDEDPYGGGFDPCDPYGGGFPEDPSP